MDIIRLFSKLFNIFKSDLFNSTDFINYLHHVDIKMDDYTPQTPGLILNINKNQLHIRLVCVHSSDSYNIYFVFVFVLKTLFCLLLPNIHIHTIYS